MCFGQCANSTSWGFQKLTEAMTNPAAISVDLSTWGNVNLAGLSGIFKTSPIVQWPGRFRLPDFPSIRAVLLKEGD
jgi:hypothetical protein